MARAKPNLQRGLDREVHQIVQKILRSNNNTDSAESSNTANRLSTDTVYERIRRSNSSLARRSKVLLLDSIDRILSSIQDLSSESEDSWDHVAREEENRRLKEPDASNAMNRKIAKGFQTNTKRMAETAPEFSRSPKRAIARPVENSGRVMNDTSNTGLEITHGALQSNGVKSKGSDQGRDAHNHRTVSHPSGRPDSVTMPSRSQFEADIEPPSDVSLSDLGGMDDVIKRLEKHVLLPLKFPARYYKKRKIPRGVLLHGPPGCGKTMLCEALGAQLQIPFVRISAPSIVSGMSGESEKTLRNLFERAISVAPCVIFLDEIDAITPKRDNAHREMEKRIVTQLLTCMDDLALEKTDGKPVIVLATTNRPDSIDIGLRRAGRFDLEIPINAPDAKTRENILRAQTRGTSLSDDVDFAKLAKLTPGFVGADLDSLIFKAGDASEERFLEALKAMNPKSIASATDPSGDADANMQDISHLENSASAVELSEAVKSFCQVDELLSGGVPRDQLETTALAADTITMADFMDALPQVQPTSKREGFTAIPETSWADIGALAEVRAKLKSIILGPIQDPELYESFDMNSPEGVLLYGPPGCGKTLLGRALANEAGATFLPINGPELLSKYVGDSEKAVRETFSKARSMRPCVMFFDELDALVPKRAGEAMSEASARVVNTLLTELDGIGGVAAREGIYVVAATNRKEMIDDAMLRRGRLGEHVYVGLPDEVARVEILATLLRKVRCSPDHELEDLMRQGAADFARLCKGFSGADLAGMLQKAKLEAVGHKRKYICLEDLEKAKVEISSC
ncbi:MAG: hypothetical protein M1831_003007 [Alyxoria varia]|nr:MAG: hypothetical protein M1831_003007 [Alyxoria varia]